MRPWPLILPPYINWHFEGPSYLHISDIENKDDSGKGVNGDRREGENGDRREREAKAENRSGGEEEEVAKDESKGKKEGNKAVIG